MEDQEIIQLIRDGKREKPIRFLYQEFPKIQQLVIKEGLTKEIAEEIFQNSLLLFIEKVENPAFVLSSKASTYLYGLNRFLTKNETRNRRKTVHVEWNEINDFDDSELNYDFEKEAKLNRVEMILTQVSEKCQSIFKLFYFEKRSMTDIAKQLNYSSTNSAKTQKYKCIEQAIKLSEKSDIRPVNMKSTQNTNIQAI